MSVGTHVLIRARCGHHPSRMSATQRSPRWSSAATRSPRRSRSANARGAPAGPDGDASPIAG